MRSLGDRKEKTKRKKLDQIELPLFLNERPVQTLNTLWASATEREKIVFMAEVGREISKNVKNDYEEKIQTMKSENGFFKYSELENLDLKSYTKSRNKLLLSLTLGLCNKRFDEIGNELPRVATIIESTYCFRKKT